MDWITQLLENWWRAVSSAPSITVVLTVALMGIGWIIRGAFAKAHVFGLTAQIGTQEQRIALLTRIAQNELKPVKPEELFFRELKGRTANAYYSSKIGIHTEMEYKGNTYLKEFVGYDAT